MKRSNIFGIVECVDRKSQGTYPKGVFCQIILSGLHRQVRKLHIREVGIGLVSKGYQSFPSPTLKQLLVHPFHLLLRFLAELKAKGQCALVIAAFLILDYSQYIPYLIIKKKECIILFFNRFIYFELNYKIVLTRNKNKKKYHNNLDNIITFWVIKQ